MDLVSPRAFGSEESCDDGKATCLTGSSEPEKNSANEFVDREDGNNGENNAAYRSKPTDPEGHIVRCTDERSDEGRNIVCY